MPYLNKEQTKLIQSDIRLRGITMESLETDLLDYLCSCVEKEMEVQPSFEVAYHTVLQTLKPNELKIAQMKTQELLENKISPLQKVIYVALFFLVASVVGYMFFIPWTGEIIGISILTLVGLYIYSQLRWYFNPDGKSKRQKGLIIGVSFLVFLFLISVIFKLFHWPGAGYLMLGSLGALTFVPVLMSVIFFVRGKKAEKHIIMEVIRKNQQKVEAVLLSLFFLGFVARLLMIDFFGNMFIISALFCFAFLFITYSWPLFTHSLDKKWRFLLLIFGTIAYGLAITTGLFKIMHWPFPYINLAVNLPYLILSSMSVIWYANKFSENRNLKNVGLSILSLVLLAYSLLLLRRISPYQELQQIIYNLPILLLFVICLIVFYKNKLFKVAAISLFGYYLLAFPYSLMPNEVIVETVYSSDQEFLRLYELSAQNPQSEEYLKHLLEYNYNKLQVQN